MTRATDGGSAVSSRVLTVPNLVSFARLATLPLLYADLAGGRHVRALVLLVVLAASDFVDGWLARRLGQVSRLGMLLDPVADRALLATIGVGFVHAGLLTWAAVAVVIVRDALVLLVGLVLMMLGRQPPEVTWLGKLATFGLLIALPLFLAASVVGGDAGGSQPAIRAVAWVLFGAGAALYWVVAFDYARRLATGVAGGRDPDAEERT